jgi:hypothetical protein
MAHVGPEHSVLLSSHNQVEQVSLICSCQDGPSESEILLDLVWYPYNPVLVWGDHPSQLPQEMAGQHRDVGRVIHLPYRLVEFQEATIPFPAQLFFSSDHAGSKLVIGKCYDQLPWSSLHTSTI